MGYETSDTPKVHTVKAKVKDSIVIDLNHFSQQHNYIGSKDRSMPLSEEMDLHQDNCLLVHCCTGLIHWHLQELCSHNTHCKLDSNYLHNWIDCHCLGQHKHRYYLGGKIVSQSCQSTSRHHHKMLWEHYNITNCYPYNQKIQSEYKRLE
jgi:hypothetical protein